MKYKALAIGLAGITALSLAASRGAAQGTIRDELRMSAEDEAAEIRTPEDEANDQAARDSEAAASFRKAYARMRSPRIAVFVNRELSGEVREVQPIAGTDAQFAVAHRDGESELRLSGAARSSHWVGLAPDGSRPMPDEDWVWELEEGFEAPFQEAGARLIDRATIVRLAAHGESRDGIDYAALSPKRVEVSALKGHADVFIELLVTRAPRAAAGYRLKAVAKDVRSGRILASALDQTGEGEPAERLVLTDAGYDLVAEQDDSVDGPARALAVRLMEKLASAWR